jgi:signal transduction histidine kinase/FixJ family two-component response regulator
LHLQHANTPFIFVFIDNLAFSGYLLFILLAGIQVFREFKKQIKNIEIYIPIFLIFAMIFLALSFLTQKTSDPFFDRLFSILESFLCYGGFAITIFCLAISKNKGLLYTSLGFGIGISSDFVINYGLFSQKYGISSMLETSWIITLLFIIYGLSRFRDNKAYQENIGSWISEYNSLKAKCALFVFFFSILLLIIFTGTSYILYPDKNLFWNINSQIFCTILVIFSVLSALSSNLLAKRMYVPIKRIEKLVNAFMEEKQLSHLPKEIEFDILEIDKLENFINKSFAILRKKSEVEKQLATISAQVAHDIRSPLAALQTIVKHTANLSEDTRIMLRNAADRINDISNNLRAKEENPRIITANPNNSLSIELITCLLDGIFSEKRLQYAEHDIKLKLDIANDAQGLFALVNPEKFKRVISNVLNNAVEATVRKKGTITLHLTKENNRLVIKVEDDGVGIPPTILERIGIERVTYGKENGSGIGLSSSIRHIAEWNGQYTIESAVDEGTTFTIKLGIAETPKWFKENLFILANTNVIILDDDKSIHDVWEMRFKNFPITLYHFYNSEDFFKNLAQIDHNTSCLFLLDYELLGNNDTGIDVIKKLGPLSTRAVLVTSHYEDQAIRTKCAALNIKIIPKNFAPYIQIKKLSDDNPDYIFIDDDKMIVDLWQISAKTKKVKLASFTDIKAFDHVKDSYDKDTPIFLDIHLGDHDGISYSQELSAFGFKNIFLATNYQRDDIPDSETMPWVKGIVGKEPPFL